MMYLGDIPDTTAAQVQLEMLAHNARRASALLGSRNRSRHESLGLCVRLDERRTDEPAEFITAIVQSLATSLDNLLGNLRSMFEMFGEKRPTISTQSSVRRPKLSCAWSSISQPRTACLPSR
jgi:hypothetical protein